MREDISKSFYWGIGILAVLAIFIGFFGFYSSAHTLGSREYVECNFEQLTFVEDGEIVNIDSFNQLDEYSMDVDKQTNTVYLDEKVTMPIFIPFFYPIYQSIY